MNYGAARLAVTEAIHVVGTDPTWYPRVLVTQALIDAAIGWPRTGLRRLEKAKAALAPEDSEGLCRVALASARCYAMLQDEERTKAALETFTAVAMMEATEQRNPPAGRISIPLCLAPRSCRGLRRGPENCPGGDSGSVVVWPG